MSGLEVGCWWCFFFVIYDHVCDFAIDVAVGAWCERGVSD